TQSKTITSQSKKIESLRRELNLFLEQLSPAQKKARYERLEQEHLQGMFNKGDGACYVDDERVGKVFDTVPLASTQDDIDNQEQTA
ncbi:MAG: hypothetical protein HRU20_25725, partial [Pseudomonadales bacterium]|nr:hypothetical protein [Pseudomonadales bacterium]